jgi:hypothetical protein
MLLADDDVDDADDTDDADDAVVRWPPDSQEGAKIFSHVGHEK